MKAINANTLKLKAGVPTKALSKRQINIIAKKESQIKSIKDTIGNIESDMSLDFLTKSQKELLKEDIKNLQSKISDLKYEIAEIKSRSFKSSHMIP